MNNYDSEFSLTNKIYKLAVNAHIMGRNYCNKQNSNLTNDLNELKELTKIIVNEYLNQKYNDE